jgi:hypothetical protein
LKFNHLCKSAGEVQEDQVASAKSSAAFLLQISFGKEFFNPAETCREKKRIGKIWAGCAGES